MRRMTPGCSRTHTECGGQGEVSLQTTNASSPFGPTIGAIRHVPGFFHLILGCVLGRGVAGSPGHSEPAGKMRGLRLLL